MGDNRMLFNLALKTFARQYENVEGLLASDDLKEIGRIMHRLKGSAATIGAQTLRDLALRTEAACKANVRKEAAAALLLICEQFKQMRGHIADLLEAVGSQVGGLAATVRRMLSRSGDRVTAAR